MNIVHRSILRRGLNFTFITRNSSVHINDDYKPGLVPKTPEEKAAVAKKYNLFPEEYEAIPPLYNGAFNWGDYPKMPDIGEAGKDIYYPYDLPEERRNFQETLHKDAIILHESKTDISKIQRYTAFQKFLGLFTACLIMFTVVFLDPTRFHPPVAAKHLYGDGRKHYSYEFED